MTYYSGGGLGGASVRWQATASAASFSPPNRDEWSFGDAGSRWFFDFGWGDEPHRDDRNASTRELSGTTDADGMHTARLEFERALPPIPHNVALTATIQDATRQTWTERANLLVHPAAAYVGLRTPRQWVLPGDSVTVEVIAVALDGTALPGRPIDVEAVRGSSWGDDDATSKDAPQRCTRISAAEPVRCRFVAPAGGLLNVTATTRDEAGRPSRSVLAVWVGGGWWRPRGADDRTVRSREVRLLPDRRRYDPGDTAAVLVTLPFSPARGVLTMQRDGLARTESFTTAGSTYIARIPIEWRDIPGVTVRVDAVATPASPSDTVAGTMYGSGTAQLSISLATRALAVRVTPRDTLVAPRGGTPLRIEVRDAAGRPVRDAEVALAVVDESVLALTGYQLRDPLALFYPPKDGELRGDASRGSVVLAPRPARGEPGVVRGTVVGPDGEPSADVVVRLAGTDLSINTDEDGAFVFTDVPPGAYQLIVSQPGAIAQVPVTVGTGPVAPLRLVLRESQLQLQGLVVTATGAPAEDFSGQGVAMKRVRDEPPPPAPPPPPPAPAVAAGAEPSGPSIQVRSDFNPLAVFVARVRTDARGRATVPATVPDNLTRYRIMVAAVADSTRYGLGESALVAAQPLMARPSAPRFLTLGDRFALPVVVQNQGTRPLTARVAVRGDGIVFTDPGREVVVPAGGRAQLSFPAEARRVGAARIQVALAGGAMADAAEVSLPVLSPATTEAFATYGVVDSGAVTLPLRLAADSVIPDYGGLEVTLASTAVQEMTDAVLSLWRYPWEGSEQIASRVLGIAGLRDVLTAFRAAGLPDSAAVRASMERNIRILATRQRDDGSFRHLGREERGRAALALPQHPRDAYAPASAREGLRRARGGDGTRGPVSPEHRAQLHDGAGGGAHRRARLCALHARPAGCELR